MHKICFTISFISCLYMFRARAHHQEVNIASHSLWYHHTYRPLLLSSGVPCSRTPHRRIRFCMQSFRSLLLYVRKCIIFQFPCHGTFANNWAAAYDSYNIGVRCGPYIRRWFHYSTFVFSASLRKQRGLSNTKDCIGEVVQLGVTTFSRSRVLSKT